MDDLEAEVSAKLQMLKFTHGKSKGIVEKANSEAVARHRDTLRTLVKDVDALKLKIEQAKFDKGDKCEDVANWSSKVEDQVSEVDAEISLLEKWLEETHLKADDQKRKDNETKETRARGEQLKFEREQLEIKLEFERKFEETRKSQTGVAKAPHRIQTKLPKLELTKFEGNYTEWLSFWNKFHEEIDKSNLAPVTKFAYLKELVAPKVRAEIDGLPFTSEGYERAKNILSNEYGRTSEIVNAYIQNIMALPVIIGSEPAKVHEFYKQLVYNVQSLETLGKLKNVTGNVRSVLDKLKGIKSDLVRGHPDWQDWDFSQLVKALKLWKDVNPVENKEQSPKEPPRTRGRNYQAKDDVVLSKACVYCDATEHKSVECNKVVSTAERKKILGTKRLCFNCTGAKHRAAECRSRSSCRNCRRKHHSSICDKVEEKMMTATTAGRGNVCHPLVVVKVNGVMCRALLDTGAGSSYASSALIDCLKATPQRTEIRRIEMMMGSTTKRVELYNVSVSNVSGDFTLGTEVTKIDRSELLTVDNPKYEEIINRYQHLKGVRMDDKDEKQKLPVHLILGTSDFAKIKTEVAPRVGRSGEPIAEKTRFGWTVMSPGVESDLNSIFMTQTSVTDYEQLCRLDVLGLEDSTPGDQEVVHTEFKEQLKRSPEGWYQSALPWKGNHPILPNNKSGSLRRLSSTVKKLEKTGMLERYDDVIQEQLAQGVVERAEQEPKGKEFYIPHKAVVKETAQTTKLRIVYDASAKAHDKAPSLNDCLNTGPPLQNQLWKVLVRSRFHPIAITGDIKQAFLQVRIREEDRDALRFHWLEDLATRRVSTFRFTRALFGLGPSPFLLGGVIKQHLDDHRAENPKCVEEIERSLYVDDLISGGQTVAEARRMKDGATEIFSRACFTLHKWHSNISELQSTSSSPAEDGVTYAKQQLGTPQATECGLLGLVWTKDTDQIAVKVGNQQDGPPTKRGILCKVARIYDPLGLAAPLTLEGKSLYRDACDARISWDAELPRDLQTKWSKWERGLPSKVTAPRSLVAFPEEIQSIDLHAFGDASGKGVAAAVYAVVTQGSGISKGLVAAKARLAKQGLTIPRLELVSGHMATNLVDNVKEALTGFPVQNVYGWLDSTVALHWILGGGEYKQFVHNRVQKIRCKEYMTWRHVPSQDNPADLGSRGGNVSESRDLWWEGPNWLSHPEHWPADIVTSESQESKVEAKQMKQLFKVAITGKGDQLDKLLEKWSLWRTLRICGWISRFVHNVRSSKESRIKGPLATKEIEDQKFFWEKRVQERNKDTSQFEEDRHKLNLQPNSEGILECRGRIQGDYPVYLPDDDLYTEKQVQHAHEETLHGGVGLTMAKIRQRHWVPRLRRLARRVIKSCHGCKRFQVTALASPPPGNLPKDRTEGSSSFQVVGVDYAGPIRYRKSAKQEGKAYIVLYACSLTRAVYLELTKTMGTDEFLTTLKRFIARKGRPEKVYSDNGKTFVAAAKWLKQVMRDERFNDFLAKMSIKWQFNLSRAPWWGGQFERMVGLVKRALYKSVGNGYLTWEELQDVLLDVEVSLNNRPLSYVEEDVQLPLLTPNALQFGCPNLLPDREEQHIDDRDLRKRAKYIRRCKDVLWRRWSAEYVKGLRERHNLQHNTKQLALEVGDVVVIKADEKNRGKWKLGIVEALIQGTDGVVRGARLRAGKSYMERPIQHLYPLELSCDRTRTPPSTPLNAESPEFRPRRAAAEIARERLREMADDEP